MLPLLVLLLIPVLLVLLVLLLVRGSGVGTVAFAADELAGDGAVDTTETPLASK